jgi:hypothetical protein
VTRPPREKGEKGAKGEKGEQGDKGEKGEKGERGAARMWMSLRVSGETAARLCQSVR